ncbi:DUF3426 domain-containing protein [Aromatoleum anaerobium]|uniref:DUF3426 domain-containing protein n=1 Tax=Aromatoleum anaerobium TaxID=182180 RepID=UPI001FF0FBA0|nr:DUF3426 domain-containing protein [Aromatoleum anaerobium]MCK0509342.1 zinc-ribbon domain-containing protein [Aromatoleum anaerobium]
MFARCPACQTVFRVQPEQLRAHQGEVRCGRCYASFNALDRVLHVAPAAPAPAPPVPQPPAAAAPAPEPVADRGDRFFILDDPPARATVTQHVAFPSADDRTGTGTEPGSAPGRNAEIKIPQFDDFSDSLDFEIQETFVTSRPPAAQSPVHSAQAWSRQGGYEAFDAFDKFVDRPQPPFDAPGDGDRGESEGAATFIPEPFEPRDHREPVLPRDGHLPIAMGDTAAEDGPLPPIRRVRTVSIAPKPLDAPAAPASATLPAHQDDDDEPPSGHASSRARAANEADDRAHLDATYGAPASSGKRWLPGLGVGILLGALAVQSVFVFRDDITRKWPQLRPAYLSACAPLKCTLPLPRVAGAISIEASALQSEPGRAARFVLNATIRNRAPHPQAYPHLELTLTDVQDQPLVRRVLGPAQWLPAGLLEQGGAEQKFDAGRDIVVQLPFEAPGVEATGYRVYAFYP